MNHARLVLVTKRPQLGIGKQRIADRLGPALAQQLATHLTDCALEDLRQWQGPTGILIADHADTSWATTQAPEAVVVTQINGNLGARLAAGYAQFQQRQTATEALLFIGSDCPALTPDYLNRCARALDQHDIVLGLADDGGAVVMGSRTAWPPLADLPWSTPKLAEALTSACAAADLSVVTLPALSDVDHACQLRTLAADLANDQRPARIQLREYLETLETGRPAPADIAG